MVFSIDKESKKNLSTAHIGIGYKPVIGVDKTGRKIQWEGIKFAAKAIGTTPTSVSSCLKGRLKTIKGFTFTYL